VWSLQRIFATPLVFLLFALGITMLAPSSASAQGSGDSETTADADPPADSPLQKTADSPGFLRRFAKAYWDDWKGADDPDLPRRGYPAPVSSPPFPFSDWPYGGSPVIGAPDTAGGPLMSPSTPESTAKPGKTVA
jgi:hypothetical protein